MDTLIQPKCPKCESSEGATITQNFVTNTHDNSVNQDISVVNCKKCGHIIGVVDEGLRNLVTHAIYLSKKDAKE